MLLNKDDFFLPEFAYQKGLVHGFSTRKFGDCNPKRANKNWRNVEKFLATLGLKKENLVLMEQVHGKKIKIVGTADQGKIILAVDGLITKSRGVVLGVNMADCLPILFYDPVAKLVGIAHAGWQGVLKKLPQKMVDSLVKIGALPENILVGIGPHIGDCCYNVEKERIKMFTTVFGLLSGMIKKKGKYFLDLVAPTRIQLINSGLAEKNLIISDVCTSCQNKEFFSHRKDSPQNSGGTLGVIGLK